MAVEENQIRIVWSPEDIQTICPDMNDADAIEAIHTIRDSFKDRATEEGWNILETLLEMYGYKKEEDE